MTNCSVTVSSAKKISMSILLSVRWLTLIDVALVCVALFQMMSPSPG
jgi:hypothetical protein